VLRLRFTSGESGQDTAIHTRLNRQMFDCTWSATWIYARPPNGVGMLAAGLGKAFHGILTRNPENTCRVIFTLGRVDVDVVILNREHEGTSKRNR
jgi:hypothetical protein